VQNATSKDSLGTREGTKRNTQGYEGRTQGAIIKKEHASVTHTCFHGLLVFGIQNGAHSELASILDFYVAKTLRTRLNIFL